MKLSYWCRSGASSGGRDHLGCATYIRYHPSTLAVVPAVNSFTYDAAPPLVDSTFRVGHVLRLCPSWRHNPHLDFGPFSIRKELGNSLSLSSLSILLRIRVDFGQPFFRINRGLGITSLVSSGSGHPNLSTVGILVHSCGTYESRYSKDQ
nr:hypothetical protein CFP56_36680 [Quercus suber]